MKSLIMRSHGEACFENRGRFHVAPKAGFEAFAKSQSHGMEFAHVIERGTSELRIGVDVV